MIEVSIPVRSLQAHDDSDDEDLTCYICANAFCSSDSCGRSLTHLGCCTQAICCSCLVKGCKRCGCKEDCDAVISLCPFCREIAPVETLDMFLGGKPPCADCVKNDSQGETGVGACTEADPSEGSPD